MNAAGSCCRPVRAGDPAADCLEDEGRGSCLAVATEGGGRGLRPGAACAAAALPRSPSACRGLAA
eukprot:12242283-Heterocapsa_arctica.AAC.1